MVISACGTLSDKIRSGKYDTVIKQLIMQGVFSKEQMEEAVNFFDRDMLQYKYDVEMGSIKDKVQELNSVSRENIFNKNVSDAEKRENYVETSIEPLGILFHIAAGNAEGLPFFSVVEGMLAGNVNILKLPSVDDGLSLMLLKELVDIEPKLAPYICILDVPSTNFSVMKKLADMADGIVLWGGDEAVRAVRTMASPQTQIISWGHKLSFAYITEDADEEELCRLAEHICETRQVLCNSCQGIFVDTDDKEVVKDISRRFLHILENAGKKYPKESVGVRGKVTISLYNEDLEIKSAGLEDEKWILKGDGVSVIGSMDSELKLSYMFRNCWVKPLPRKELVKVLKGYKGHLQTVGLICAKNDRRELADKLTKAGVTRITSGGNMSHTFAGAAHDGEYPLRRYSRIVELEL